MPQRLPRATGPAEALILENDALAVSIATRYFHLCKGFDKYDAVQIARFGLIRAARKYDAARVSPHTQRPTRFSSYAVPFIRGEILHYLRDRGYLLKVPRRLKERASRCQRLAAVADVSCQEIARREGWDWGELEEVLELHIVYPDSEFFEESLTAEELPDESVRDAISQALSHLPAWQSKLVIAVYYQGRTVAQVAAESGQDPDAVQSWLSAALSLLQSDPTLSLYAAV